VLQRIIFNNENFPKNIPRYPPNTKLSLVSIDGVSFEEYVINKN